VSEGALETGEHAEEPDATAENAREIDLTREERREFTIGNGPVSWPDGRGDPSAQQAAAGVRLRADVARLRSRRQRLAGDRERFTNIRKVQKAHPGAAPLGLWTAGYWWLMLVSSAVPPWSSG
jgi:hypothetical protein